MALLKKKTMKKRAPRRRMNRRRNPVRKYARGGHIKEYAAAQYSTANQLLTPSQAQAGAVYAFRNFSLAAASTRVQNIAQSYQEYRIKRITWEARGFFDSFVAPSSATAPTVPHLYWRIDKLGTYNADTTLNTLKASGCKPIRLDDKLVRKSFKPTVLQGVAAEASTDPTSPFIQLGTYRTSPWLPTNAMAYSVGKNTWVPSTIDHLGLILGIDCDVVPFGGPAGAVSFTVEFEFRKPLDDIDPNGESVMQVVDLSDLQPKPLPPPEATS